MRNYYITAAVVVAAFIAIGASSFRSVMTGYVLTFAEARASNHGTIQVPGDVIKERTTYKKEDGTLVFYMRDGKKDEMEVIYKGPKPGNFDQADRVVAIGKYHDGAFHADRLLVKCPSKYQKN